MFTQFLVIVAALACKGFARPASVPSTSLNIPIEEAALKPDGGEAVDTAKDRSMVEPTFREPKIQEFIHTTLARITRPVPLIDTIREEEKYGNRGDQLDFINNAIVRGTEVATDFIGTAVAYPGQLFRNVSNNLTARLNSVGSSLIGL